MMTSARDSFKPVTPSHFLHVRDGYRLRNRCGLKNIKTTGEAASAEEEPAATFPAEWKFIRVSYNLRLQASTEGLGMYIPRIRRDYCSSTE